MSLATGTSSLRDAHKDLTRGRILDAAIEILKAEDLEALTMAAVAGQAGVTERTIYRHFATRDELLGATWPRLQARVGSKGFSSSAQGVAAMPTWLFPNFDAEEGAVRASAFSKAGRELRMAVNEERKAAFLRAVQEARPELEGQALIRAAAIVQLIDSAFAWAVMKDFWGLSGAESGRAASEAIAALLRLDPGFLNQSETEAPKSPRKD